MRQREREKQKRRKESERERERDVAALKKKLVRMSLCPSSLSFLLSQRIGMKPNISIYTVREDGVTCFWRV